MFTPNGPGGIFGLYVNPGSNLGYVAFNEFVCVRAAAHTFRYRLPYTSSPTGFRARACDFFVQRARQPPLHAQHDALAHCIRIVSICYPRDIILGSFDASLFCSGVLIWGFAPIGLAANAARDLGGRFAALTLFGQDATGGNYAAIAALMSIPATLLAGVFYELIFNDSQRSTSLVSLFIPDLRMSDRRLIRGIAIVATNPDWQHLYLALAAEQERKAGGDDGADAAPSLHSLTRSDEKLNA